MKISIARQFYELLPSSLKRLAQLFPKDLYVVGGSVRDFLAGIPLGTDADWDICADADETSACEAARAAGFSVKAVYSNTGTVKLQDGDGLGCEYSRFRTDLYVRGKHTPETIAFTSDITQDARRRDFCANAVYYDIRNEEFVDPLGGIRDIHLRKLRTVAPARKVFGEDGLRLLRLARFSAQLGFYPDRDCFLGARANAALIKDIVPERIFAELCAILHADERQGDAWAPYRGMDILRGTGVLGYILPELAAGDGLKQPEAYHAYDVLEHSLRCMCYAPAQIRWAALLHDVGKPYCNFRDGNFHAHAEEGARIAGDILVRLRAPKKLIERVRRLVLLHMRDYDLNMRENKVRLTLVREYPLLGDLLALKQADYSACKDDLSPAPCVMKWECILAKMREEGVPFTQRKLAVNGQDLREAGVPAARTGEALTELLEYCAENGARNERERLLSRAKKLYVTEK